MWHKKKWTYHEDVPAAVSSPYAMLKCEQLKRTDISTTMSRTVGTNQPVTQGHIQEQTPQIREHYCRTGTVWSSSCARRPLLGERGPESLLRPTPSFPRALLRQRAVNLSLRCDKFGSDVIASMGSDVTQSLLHTTCSSCLWMRAHTFTLRRTSKCKT